MKNLEIRSSISVVSLRSFREMAMRLLMFCAFCFFALIPGNVLMAQIAAEEPSPSAEESESEFPGTYIFEWPEGRSVAEIHLVGSVLTGTLEIPGGYTIQLIGTAQGEPRMGQSSLSRVLATSVNLRPR